MTSPENYSIVDRRGRTASGLQVGNLTQEMGRLRQAGVSMPASGPGGRAKTAAIVEMVNTPGSLQESARVQAQMRRSRMAAMSRTASNVQMAMPRIREPLGTLRNQNIPCDYNDPKSLAEARAWSRLYYATHDLVPLLVDIYCLAGDTKVITHNEGNVPIRDLAGRSVKVLTKGGRWAYGDFRSFGRQPLWDIVLTRHGVTKTISATTNHRWFVGGDTETITSHLSPGDELVTTGITINSLHRTNPSTFGIAHGFVYGDGSMESNGGTVVDLHGHGGSKHCMEKYFNGSPVHHYDFLDGKHPRIYGLPGYFKKLPSLKESAAYLAGWFAGYFAADGRVSQQGKCELSSVDKESLEFVRSVCNRLGVWTFPIYDSGERESVFSGDSVPRKVRTYTLNIDPWSLDEKFFCREDHRTRWAGTIAGRPRKLKRSNWRVESVTLTDRVEEVFCGTLPETESFVLEDYILTGNCRFPLTGLEFVSNDSKIEQAFNEMFLDDLDYEDWLPNALGREYFLAGECTVLGHFDEELGVWTSEEILDPDMVRVSKSLFVDQERVQLSVKDLVEGLQNPPKGGATESRSEELDRHHQLAQLKKYYPEIIAAAAQDDGLDIAEPRWSRLVNRVSPWDLRGVPPLMRSFGTLMFEESLIASQTAIADRLYSPMLVATLGIQDMGDGQPWIPTQDDLGDLRDDLQTALMADFKLITHHMGLKIESVFGRESVPRFDTDYDRVDMKLMQAWGIGAALIMGGTSAAGTYASSALNREVCELNMRDFQRKVIKHINKRAEVVAEAQRFYDYERKFSPGLGRTPVYRKVLRFNEETGQQEVVKAPKLLIPTVRFNSLNLRDEATERQFYMELKSMGVPVSDKTLAINLNTDFDEEIPRQAEETVNKLVAQAEAMGKAKSIIDEKNRRLPVEQRLPYPPDMINYLTQTTMLRQQLAAAEMAEGQADMMDQQAQAMSPAGQLGILPPPAVLPPPPGAEQGAPEPPEPLANRTRPPESDEMRAGAPRAAKKRGMKADGNAIVRKKAFFEDPMSSYGDRYRVSEDDVDREVKRREMVARHPMPLVSDLVEDPSFFQMLNSPHEGQIRADYPNIAAGKDKDSESAKLLRELVDQYSYLTGREPQWD